ncbi:MAG: ATP-binding protein, partial [Bacteroidetes bacterium]|nr:ATP-binding protein [Bacteroidota bacterium]
ELYQMNVMDLVHPDFRDFVKQRAIARLKGLKFTDHYEFAIVTKNGEKRYIDFGGTLIEFDDKPAIIASAYDITDRKRMEEALKKSEEQYRSFFEEDATADVLFQPDGRVEDCNPAYVKMFRLNSREEALATKIFEFCLDKESREKTLGLIREQRKLFDHELVLRRRDDSPLYAKANFIGVFDEHGELIQIKAYLIDETERKSLEKRLIQSQKLEGIGRLAGGVAHDYNNILGVILGYGELIQNKLKKEDPLHRQIQSIVAAANRGKDLTRQLLAFARKEIVSPKVLNVNTSIDSIQKMLQRLIGENIKLIFMPGKSLWSIKIDPTQLDQILVNLATNARDAISDIGTITIETANVAIDEAYLNGHAEFFPGEYVMLGFTDTGKGMDRATQEKIFEPFFTTKPKGQGTGLGLATVYGIVKQNGGNINVYSELGKGTTVKIYLPRFYGEAEEAEEIEEDKSTVGTETVLVVEDQADLLELAKNSLEEYGYKVLTAWTPGEAILLCGEYTEEIDLLLTDVIMPVMNGKELKKRIDKLKPGIKTIFMSGYTANVIAHRGILEEGIEFIQKPFTPRALAKKVHDVLQK